MQYLQIKNIQYKNYINSKLYKLKTIYKIRYTMTSNFIFSKNVNVPPPKKIIPFIIMATAVWYIVKKR